MSDATGHSTPTTPAGGRQPGAAPRVLFACGGTGGHVYPAIAIADEVRALAPDAQIVFAGTRDRMEWEAVPKAGYQIEPVTVSGFQRGLSATALRRNASFPFKLGKGLIDSVRLMRRFDPDVVVGTGGYVAGPVGLAAALNRRPLVLQEQNAYAGATNKLLARFASRVFVAFDAALAYFPEDVTRLAGNPVRRDLAAVDIDAARAHFGLEDGQTALLAMGGSLGAAPINEALRANLDTLLAREDLVVIWQTGSRFFDALRQRVPEHPRLRLLAYLDRMDYAYAAADVAVCRAGAITCSELALTGTPSILVPSPNVTADHQTKNARAMADAGAAILLPEARLAARLPETLATLIEDGDSPAGARMRMAAAAKALARPDASRTIAEEVLALAKRRGDR